MSKTTPHECKTRIVKTDEARRIVYGVVYAPGEIDAHGETMLAEDIETMAHSFMRLIGQKQSAVIDQQHDNVPVNAYPIESYVERSSDNSWPVGSWIMGVKIDDAAVWAKVVKGELNGFSFEAMVSKISVVASVEYDSDLIGKTSENEGHDHVFFLEYDDEGRVTGGTTSFDMGHRHQIKLGTATDFATGPGLKLHSHRLPV